MTSASGGRSSQGTDNAPARHHGPALRSLRAAWAGAGWGGRIPALLAALVILVQIAWVLVPDDARVWCTIASVTLFAAASATHALWSRGARWTVGYLAIALGLGWAVEALGRTTGYPFGTYDYTDALGWKLLGVPLVIPMAWAMMAYPCLLLARTLSESRVLVPIIAAWTLAAWDLFLDPQMVGEGYWSFAFPTPALPGSPGIPLTNYLGWLVVSLVMMSLLDRLPRQREGLVVRGDGVPTALLAWTYLSSVLANAAFFGRPWVAVWGALGMGITVLPWLLRLGAARRR